MSGPKRHRGKIEKTSLPSHLYITKITPKEILTLQYYKVHFFTSSIPSLHINAQCMWLGCAGFAYIFFRFKAKIISLIFRLVSL